MGIIFSSSGWQAKRAPVEPRTAVSAWTWSACPWVVSMVLTGRGLERAAASIAELRLDTIALFTGNPSAWRSAAVDVRATDQFRKEMERLDVRPVLSHAMYLINLASPNPTFYQKSQDALVEELVRAPAYGCDDVVAHIGSHMGEGREAGIARAVKALDAVLSRAAGGSGLLLEISAGGGA